MSWDCQKRKMTIRELKEVLVGRRRHVLCAALSTRQHQQRDF